MKPIPALLTCLVIVGCAPGPRMVTNEAAPVSMPVRDSGSLSQSVARGGAFAAANCASCHALAADGASPLAAAPPLREIARRYPVEDLSEAFAEGFVSTHSEMPRFVLEARENRDLLAYLNSIQTSP